ncbi:MAG: hypothetical protein QM696_09195 [Steroidobacteraceae bacterium]
MKRAVLLAALLAAAAPAMAIERIQLQATSIQRQIAGSGTVTAHEVWAALTLGGGGRSRIELRVPRLALPAALTTHTGAVTQIHLLCENPVIREPEFSCPALTAQLRAARLPPLALRGRVALRSDTGNAEGAGTLAGIAGSTLAFDVRRSAHGLAAGLALPAVQFRALRELAAPWLTLPEDLQIQGEADFHAQFEQRAGSQRATLSADLRDAGFQNAAATWIGEKIAARITASADLAATPMPVELQFAGTGGQFLGGVVLLDFDRNPLQADLQGRSDGHDLIVDALHWQQRNLTTLSGSAEIRLEPFAVRRAAVDLEQLQFPDAYTSYMQLLLATTPFNQLQTAGAASGRIVIADNLPAAADLRIEALDFSDAAQQLDVSGVSGELHWTDGAAGPPRPSFLAWESSRGWGIEGARTRIDFATSARSFQLLRPARLPFFDGALLINTLRGQDIGMPQMEGDFDAVIEPISVQPIARAMGWPDFSGSLSGRLPGLTYRNGVLAFSGNVEAEVFDGRVVASNLSVKQPFSAWPQLHADITARNLDLDLITRTFEFGSITGRLDADLLNLQTFNWSPIAFDLRMATPPGDRSRRRISQRAVENLSNLGGGGGVAAALQTGALRFFDEFRYARLGISCRLRNDVCQMDGVGKAGAGFYIVRGSGIPRIDIIGNEHRVDWPRLVSQITTALGNTEGIVVN